MKKINQLFLSSLISIAGAISVSSCGLIINHDSSSSSSSFIYSSEFIEDNGYIHIVREKETYEVLTEDYLFKGFNGHYTVTGQDINGNEIKDVDAQVRWSSSDLNIAKVDYLGTVEVKAAGTFILRATYGNYSDELVINTAIIANQFETTELQDEYRSGNTYNIPISFTPYNATVTYTSSDASVISVDSSKKTFKVLKSGIATIKVEAFTHFSGVFTTLNIEINALDKNAPRFEIGNRTTTNGTVSVAKNQYKELNFNKLDIYAFSSNGTDISSNIVVDSGDYDLTTIGTYQIVLKVNDDNNRFAYFYLKLEVTEFETVKIDSVYASDGIEEISHSITPVKIQYSYAVKEIEFTMDIKLNDRYDAADINIRWLIYFKIKRWDDSNYVDHSENAIIVDSYSMTKDGERTLHMYYKYSNANSLDLSTLTDIGFYAVGIGTYYKYIYYK